MPANLKNVNDIMLGTGTLKVNGQDVGQLKGDVTFKYGTEFYEVTGGFPATTLKKVLIKESATLSAGMLEVNPAMLAVLLPQLTLAAQGAAEVTATEEYLGVLVAGQWKGAAYHPIKEAAATVSLCGKLTAQALTGATKIYVDDASMFTAGDTVKVTNGTVNDAMTIAALGVNESENSLTFTGALAHDYALGDLAINTAVSLVEGTDYYVDRINGTFTRVTASTAIEAGFAVCATYVYITTSGQALTGGGKIATAYMPAEFRHTRDDGKEWVLVFPLCQLTGDFELGWKEDSETILNVELSAVADSTKVAGAQLFSLTLED